MKQLGISDLMNTPVSNRLLSETIGKGKTLPKSRRGVSGASSGFGGVAEVCDRRDVR
jgi:hypothetical protein